jgi:hypothetical protein
MPRATLTLREINRATLARQMLLARQTTPPLRALERLLGLQAQLARPPFIALWARLAGFRREALVRLLLRKQVVRAPLMRGTLHLVSAADYPGLRGVLQPVLDRGMRSVLRDRMKGVDVTRVIDGARAWFGDQPRTFDQFRKHLLAASPRVDIRAAAFVVRCQLPLIQVPAETPWGYPGAAAFAVADRFLSGAADAAGFATEALVMRYLAAFGPATVSDAQTWSGLGQLREAFETLRPKLTVFRDPRGRELFDLPRAPRPDPATPAPVRFLPDFDNLILGHEVRTRLVADEHRPALITANLLIPPTFLVDGFVAGTWKIERARTSATLGLRLLRPLSRAARAELETEGQALLRFVESDAATFRVRIAPAGGKGRPRG